MNNKLNYIILYPQGLTPPKDYQSIDDHDTKALKANCLFYWMKHQFPDCCDFHRQRILDRQLDLEAWSNSGEHLFEAITYTVFFVKRATKDPEGLARSKTYIDSILFSFGTHSPIRDKYIEWTVAILKKEKSGNNPFLRSVIDYLTAPEEGAFEQLAAAEQAFHKWLGSLPEDLIPEEIKQNLLLIFLRGIIKSLSDDDEFSGVRRLELNSVDQFLDYLSDTTESILHEILQSIARGDVLETIIEASIINRNKTVTEINLAFKNYSDPERNYLTIIQRWGNMVSSFIDREIERKKSLTDLTIPHPVVIETITAKPLQTSGPSFPELFRDPSYYDKFINLLTRMKLIDENLAWIDDDKNKMIGIFWGLLQVEKEGRSIFIPKPPRPTPYARKVYEHFQINQAALCSERYLRDHQKHNKVTDSIKDKFTKELASALFPNN